MEPDQWLALGLGIVCLLFFVIAQLPDTQRK